ncbi:MAG: DEAD/DEAH box helicase family protein [Candidatus Absconditabacterales bacterium]|nr:DEAD/DEAH box helicase family protein [Candidatus Absconditabacterales bacterium]
MGLSKDFPRSPYTILEPDIRWFPGDADLFKSGHFKLLPPLVQKIRMEVFEWRKNGYKGATKTSKALLNWWFKTEHIMTDSKGVQFQFQYYFAQREAVETVIWLYEVAKAKDKYDLMKFSGNDAISPGMFVEDWTRYVVKMATGSGKTKVITLLLARSYFNRKYEEDSTLSKNFLVIAPNIIVLDRLRTDFDGLKIFFEDPILPDNGYEGEDWRNDFQISLHIQDEVGTISETGNIFLTNIHRVFDSGNGITSAEDENSMDYFLGTKPVGKTNESKIDLGDIVRGIDELMIINDEAHHIHDESLAWFKSIQDITYKLRQKGKDLSLQLDVTATPKHEGGGIFVQTICDYPLVEAIAQGVVKTPVLPDQASRAKLQEYKSAKYSEMYKDYLDLGYEERRKASEEMKKVGKKAVLFVMTDDTKNCDDVAEFMRRQYPEFEGKDSVLVIHTKNNGEISETASGKSKEELEKLRKLSNEIDSMDSPYKAVVSVLMLREGRDVKNVTTIVGLRSYVAKSNILPEQTLGRGLRRMFRGQSDVKEELSVVGTNAFMDFVESIKEEGVELEKVSMGRDSGAKTPIVIEVDKENMKKDIETLDIELPILTPRIYREYKNLSELHINEFEFKPVVEKEFTKQEQKEIVFKDISTDEQSHTTVMEGNIIPNATNVVGYFTRSIMKELRLFSGYDILYGLVKHFTQYYLFGKEVDLSSLNILRNLSELEVSRTITETFKKEINKLTILDRGEAEIKNYIKISKTRPFMVNNQAIFVPKKSVFNKIIGDSHFELQFASFLDGCDDIVSFAKNYLGVEFKIDYKNADGNIANYYPDFLVKKDQKTIYIIETKGREDLDDRLKIERLKQYCEDANSREQKKITYKMLYIKQEDYEKYTPRNFEECIKAFSE